MAGQKKDYVWQDVTLTEDDKAMKLVKIYRALRSDDSNPFSFLHTFSFFLYFHMLSSSLNLVFNIHYYIIT